MKRATVRRSVRPDQGTHGKDTAHDGPRPVCLSRAPGDTPRHRRFRADPHGQSDDLSGPDRRRAHRCDRSMSLGTRRDGRREVLGFDVGNSEAGAFWTSFLRSLKARGLTGTQLVISDAHDGLKGAISSVLLGTSWKRCSVHFLRNVLAKIPRATPNYTTPRDFILARLPNWAPETPRPQCSDPPGSQLCDTETAIADVGESFPCRGPRGSRSRASLIPQRPRAISDSTLAMTMDADCVDIACLVESQAASRRRPGRIRRSIAGSTEGGRARVDQGYLGAIRRGCIKPAAPVSPVSRERYLRPIRRPGDPGEVSLRRIERRELHHIRSVGSHREQVDALLEQDAAPIGRPRRIEWTCPERCVTDRMGARAVCVDDVHVAGAKSADVCLHETQLCGIGRPTPLEEEGVSLVDPGSRACLAVD